MTMYSDMFSLKCAIVRGGTSKGVFVMSSELPEDKKLRNKFIAEIFGSPDLRQIDGLGGADVLTSKLAIVGPSTRSDADIDYTFAQVSFVDDVIDFKSNCGNISAGVAPFAIDSGLVPLKSPVTTVRIHQVNTNSIIVAHLQVENGKAKVDGNEHIDGVPIDGAPIELDFSDAAGSLTGKLLPTGNVIDTIVTNDGKSYEVSMVDAAIPTVFVRASCLGMDGIEKPEAIEANSELMRKIEEIRGRCAVAMGFVEKWEDAAKKSSYSPFFACVSESRDYVTFDGKEVAKNDIDIVSRLLFMQKMHKTHPGTGTVCFGAAARIQGSVVEKTLSERGKGDRRFVIGHPAGVIPVVSEMENKNGEYVLKNASILRTARIIMKGDVFLRNSRVYGS